MGLLDRIRTTGLPPVDDGVAVVWPSDLFRTTLAATAGRMRNEQEVRPALADFLDEFQLRADDLRPSAVAQEPTPTGHREWDALLGGVAEWLAGRHGFACPGWTARDGRFLERMWFVSGTPGFRAVALVETPAALRRRGVYIPERSLRRV